MDRSLQYVRQCEKATEIQEQKPENPQGEFIFTKEDGFAGQFCDDSPFLIFVWLPRQDQLQEMMPNTPPWCLAKDFASRAYHLSGDTTMSMEQLWLAFVMYEKYKKRWNGEEWVNG